MSDVCLDIDLNNVCRICLSQTDTSELLFNIFSDAIVDGTLVVLSEVIEYCVDIKVREGAENGMPSKICQSCKSNMFTFYVFKQKCFRTDSVLRSVVAKATLPETYAIKIETEGYSNNLRHTTEYLDESDTAGDLLWNSQLLPSIEEIEESPQDDNSRNGNYTETISEYSPSVVSSNDQEDVLMRLNTSNEEEYIEEMCEELPNSPTMSNDTTEEPVASKQLHVSITEMKASGSDCYACGICGRNLASKARLKRHMELHKDSHAILRQMTFFRCSGCRTMYLTEEALYDHRNACPRLLHPDEDAQRTEVPFLGPNDRSSEQCGICDASYSTAIEMKQHIITHMEKFSCPFEGCGCAYGSLARLNIHVNNKHVDYFSPSCPHCKEDVDQADLNQHLRQLCKAKEFTCSHCDKKFLSSRALSQHLRQLIQSFQCSQCDKSYSSRANLKLHHRTHTGERPFVCTVCNKAYKTASQRTAHMDVHIEGKTFECNICGKFLQTRTCYRNHIKRHLAERSHGCNVCGKKFYAKHTLRKHQEIIHKMKLSTRSEQAVN